jgi:hypothetical protein
METTFMATKKKLPGRPPKEDGALTKLSVQLHPDELQALKKLADEQERSVMVRDTTGRTRCQLLRQMIFGGHKLPRYSETITMPSCVDARLSPPMNGENFRFSSAIISASYHAILCRVGT